MAQQVIVKNSFPVLTPMGQMVINNGNNITLVEKFQIVEIKQIQIITYPPGTRFILNNLGNVTHILLPVTAAVVTHT